MAESRHRIHQFFDGHRKASEVFPEGKRQALLIFPFREPKGIKTGPFFLSKFFPIDNIILN